MAQLLTWSEVDSNIQSEMSNRCPSESVRLEAINNEIRNINTVYDVETTKRKVEIYIIPDGTAYKITNLVDDSAALLMSDNDFKKVADIYCSSDDDGNEYVWEEPEEFKRKVRSGYKENTYTTYFEDGDQYLAVNSENSESTATNFTMTYYSTFLGLDGSSNFVDEIEADANFKILLPARFKELVVTGAKKRLFWPSIGEDGNNQYSIESNKYKSELSKLGLDNVAKPLKKTVRKIKIRRPY